MLRNVFCVFTAAIATVVVFPFAVITLLVTASATKSMWWVRRVWSPWLLWAGGADVQIDGSERIPTNGPCFFVANHQSTIDIPVLLGTLPLEFRFIAKKSLRSVPFLGWYMWLAGFVFIDRSSHYKSATSLKQAGDRIARGTSITVFPEGTRSADRQILPFKKAPFALALRAGVPVIPVAIDGSGALMPKNSWNITPGTIRVSIGKPIDPKQFGGDRLALLSAVRNAVIDLHLAMGGKGGDRNAMVSDRRVHHEKEHA